MSKESFERLDDYQLKENYKILVPESLQTLNEADDDGIFGKIIDRGLSFVPRAMRFSKAKKVMSKYLVQYTKKAKNIVAKFASGFDSKVKTIESEYKKLLDDKIKPLIEAGDSQQIISLLEPQKKELEEYKKEQINVLDKSIESILGAYTNAMDKRIDSPGFVLNVELSDKGKGELKAKWQELAAIQTIEIDKSKTKLIQSAGWKKLEAMISEISALIEKNKFGAKTRNLEFKIQNATNINDSENAFALKIHLRAAGSRINVQEKGVIFANDPEKLNLNDSPKIVKSKGTYEFSANTYTINVNGVSGKTFAVPYMIVKETSEPIYGEGGQIQDYILQDKSAERNKGVLNPEEEIRDEK